MYLADYHTHTRFSPDAGDSMTAMAQAAIRAGLDEICFTDHVEPLVWGTTEPRYDDYDWAALTADFQAAQEAVGDRIRLRLGMEMGDPQWYPEQMRALLRTAPAFDFVIGSVHMLTPAYLGKDLYYFVPESEARAQGSLEDYLSSVQTLANMGGFNVLGHLTLPLRYLNEMRGYSVTFEPYEEQIRGIFKTLIEAGRGIELNVNRGNTPLPDARWLKLYREMGGEIITLGTDSHSTDHVGGFVRERQALLRECGFRQFCTFEKQKPVWHEL